MQVNALSSTANAVGGRTSGSVNMDNEAQLAQSVKVAALAARQLHSTQSPQDLVKRISVSVPANTTFLQINCDASSASGAALCANDFGKAYLANRQSTAVDSVSKGLTALEQRVDNLQKAIALYRAQLAALPANSPRRSTIGLERTNDDNAISSAETDVNDALPVLENLQANPDAVGSIATPATRPSSPTSPRLLLLAPSGLIVGLLIGLLLAFIRDRRDQHIHVARDVDRFLDIPVLLDVASRPGQPGLALPRSKTGQAFAELAQYVAAALGEGNHVLLVAGTATGPSASVVATNLAATLARTRSEVVLVCADLRGTVTPQLLGIGDGRGLSEVLAGGATISEVARRPADFARLRVVTPGVDSAGALQNLQHESCRRLISELRRDARYVIIEAQSVGEDAETFTLAEFADAALLAVEVGGTRRPDALDCVHRLDRLRTPVLGAAVLPTQARSKPAGRAHAPQQAVRVSTQPRSASKPRQVDRGTRQRSLADKPAPRAAQALPGPPAAGRAERDSARAAHGPTETRPLPRVDAAAVVSRARDRADTQDPADKVAGG